ncbi:MAG: membrane protein insertase YidC [Gammaproteobacteria bacterium]|nr:membrane protein insertase YidC [Gammaproteobacteria bacterium]
MNTIRPILYVLLVVILFMLWNDWEHRLPPVSPQAPPSTSLPAVPSAAPAAPHAQAAAPALPRPAPAAPEAARLVTVRTQAFTATINTRGASLVQLSLRDYEATHHGRQSAYDLLSPSGDGEFINQNGLLGRHPYPNQDSLYTAVRPLYAMTPGQTRLRVPFFWQKDGIRVTKTYTFTRDSYVVGVSYAVQNLGKTPRAVYFYDQFVHAPPPKTHFYHSAPIYIGAALYTPQGKYQKRPFPAMARHPLNVTARGGWVAVSQHYFVGAAIPPATQPVIYYDQVLPGPRYVAGYKSAAPVTIAPGATEVLQGRLFLGPKKPSLLKAAAPGLDLTVDYGWLTVLAQPLYWVLRHIESVTGNWGWAIILLTVLIKLIFFPLSAASFKSMAKMRQLQPRMAALKERHGHDRTALQQAMMELYKTEKMNPLGGCLPMIVQIPVFIALYWVLLESVALRDAPFVLWIHNLAAPDPYFVLPILMGASMLFQQLLNPAMMDPTQRKIMMIMPILFTGFFLFFPAGLVLYWVTNNVLSILQQWWVMERMKAR